MVSQYSSSMIGTSANLNHKDIVNIYQLFHALMLPSGNDASITLAELPLCKLFLEELWQITVSRSGSSSASIQIQFISRTINLSPKQDSLPVQSGLRCNLSSRWIRPVIDSEDSEDEWLGTEIFIKNIW